MGSRELNYLGITPHIGTSSMCIQLVVSFLLCATIIALPQLGYYSPGYNPTPLQFQPSDVKKAVVNLVPGGDSEVKGNLTLIQGPGHVLIFGKIFGLKAGKHGFHVHMNGDTGDNCKAAGGHAGDLGNIITSSGYQVTGINFGDE